MVDEANLRMNAQSEGFDKVQSDLRATKEETDELAEAQDGLAASGDRTASSFDSYLGVTKGATPAIDDLDAAQVKLNATSEDYTSVLGRIHPALGAIGEAGTKLTRILGDVGGANLNLAGRLRGVTAAIRRNAAAFKTLLAGGAVAAGIWLIVRAVQAMRAVLEKVNEELRKNSAVQSEATRQQRDATQAFKDDAIERDARSGDTLENLTKEQAAVERLIERYELAGRQAERARVSGRAIAGLDLTEEERRQVVLGAAGGRQALEIGPEVPEAVAAGRARRFIGRRETREDVAQIEEQERQERQLRAQRAFRDIISGAGGSQADLEQFVLKRGLARDPEQAAETATLLRRIGVTSPEDLEATRRFNLRGQFKLEGERNIIGGTAGVRVEPQVESRLFAVLEALNRQLERNRGGQAFGGPVVIQHNPRNYNTDPRSRVRVNGEAAARNAEPIGGGR